MRSAFRLTALGIGLGLLVGTGMKMLRPSSLNSLEPGNYFSRSQNYLDLGSFNPKSEITSLSDRWLAISKDYPDLTASAFMHFLDDQRYAQLNSEVALPAASSIKIAILLSVLQQVDTGQLKWNELLELEEDVIAGGAGWMALKPIGTVFPVHDIANEMIRVSDNTATNLLLKRIGGKGFLNEKFISLGLNSTEINNLLPDLSGTNITSAKDLSLTIALVETGKVLGPRTRDLFREVMSTSVSNRLIPGGLLKGLNVNDEDPDKSLLIRGYRVYNKTGDIGIAYADAALIQLPDTTRAVAAFLVKGPFNDPRSSQLIRDMAAAMAPVIKPNPPKAKQL